MSTYVCARCLEPTPRYRLIPFGKRAVCPSCAEQLEAEMEALELAVRKD